MITTIVRSGEAARTVVGENTAYALLARTGAEAAANRTELAEAAAESLVGPTYASTAAGLAAVAEGGSFAVDNGDGTVTIYRKVAGVAVEQRSLLTSAFAASGDGAGAIGSKGDGAGEVLRTQAEINAETVSVTRFGAVGDGVTDDTAACNLAAAYAMSVGAPLDMRGVFAVSNFRLPTSLVPLGYGRLTIIGDPILVQAVPNVPCLIIDDSNPAQPHANGHRFSCTVIPHPSSAKANTANIAVNLTGLSNADIEVRLGTASAYTATTGRFHTVVHAKSDSPFHYGNKIRVTASAVPAPKYGLRYVNGGGAIGNPNINQVSGYFYELDTQTGDVLLDVGDSSAIVVGGPSLFETCLNATAIKAGNLTTINSNMWIENVGVALDFTGTTDTAANNCTVSGVYFSDAAVVKVSDTLTAPPRFEGCVNDDINVTYLNQSGAALASDKKPSRTRGYQSPTNPVLSFAVGGGAITVNDTGLRHRSDHHGVATWHASYSVTPAIGRAVMRITPPAGWEIEEAVVGVEEVNVAVRETGLGAALDGRDHVVYFPNTNAHQVNVRATVRAVM